MKIFIAGATGVLGRRLVRQFQERGHVVVGLARSGEAERALTERGASSKRADLFDADSLAFAADGSDVVIHAATAIPTQARTSRADWALNDRIRREGTRALASAAVRVGAPMYLQQSVVWVATPADGSAFDESSPAQPTWLMESAFDAEGIAQEACESSRTTVGILRCGGFYSADAAHLRAVAQGLLRRMVPIVGGGDAYWSMIHADDAASAFVAAAEARKAGLWHVVDDQPVQVKNVITELARQIGAPRPWHSPVWLAKLLTGEIAVDQLITSVRTTNLRIREELGWTPRYANLRDGLEEVVSSWQQEGFLADSNRRETRSQPVAARQ
jgi:nucleoside-diphosphate-sugar epimerase